MSERSMGQVVPFRVNAARLRRSAEDYRRRGRPAEALALLRHAARQEDSTMGWLRLAEEYERLGCYEQAMLLLCRLLAQEDAPLRTWLVLGYTLAHLGHKNTALGCLYRCMDEDPYGEMAEEINSLAALLDADSRPGEKQRLPLLVGRGLRAWERGNISLGEKRLGRAIRMSAHPAPLMIQLAMLYATQNRLGDGLCCLAGAVRREPENVPALCALAVAEENLSRPRLARGLLLRAMGMCSTQAEEEMVIAAAWAVEAWGLCEDYLSRRLREQPCSIMLLLHRAELYWVKHQPQRAMQYWRQALQIDPDSLHARAMLRWAEHHTPEDKLPQPPLPRETMEDMSRALEDMERRAPGIGEMLDPDGEMIQVVNWCFHYGGSVAQLRCLGLVGQDCPQARLFLRQVMTHPFAHEQARKSALHQLRQWGEKGPLPMRTGSQLTRVLDTTAGQRQTALWRMFALRLATGTQHRAAVLGMGLHLWLRMTVKERIQAAGPEREGWLQAMEILCLRRCGQEKQAEEVLRRRKCPERRIAHRLRVLEKRLDKAMEENEP